MPNKESMELFAELHRLGRQLHRIPHREGHEGGHYREAARLLRLIAENDGIMQRDLAEQMDVRPSSMTEMLTRMEAHGLITREQDEKDARVFRIRLTEEGRAMDKEAGGRAAELVTDMFKGFSDEEIAELLALIRKLGANLDAMAPAYGPHDRRGWHHHGFGDDDFRRGFCGHHGPCYFD